MAEVRDAIGRGNVSIASGYLQAAVDSDAVGILFGWECPVKLRRQVSVRGIHTCGAW